MRHGWGVMAADSGIIRGGLGGTERSFQTTTQQAGLANQQVGVHVGFQPPTPPRSLVLRIEAFDGNAPSAVASTTVTIPIPAVSLRLAKMLALELAMKGLKAWLHEGLKSLGCK